MDSIQTMRYAAYKQHYADCQTVCGSYDAERKTIDVLIPDGRMKPSGVRGERFRTIWLEVGSDAEHVFTQGFRAVCYSNALKQAVRQYPFVKDAKQ